jgi:hypothetical protein
LVDFGFMPTQNSNQELIQKKNNNYRVTSQSVAYSGVEYRSTHGILVNHFVDVSTQHTCS